jgi:PKD repeat protein
VLSYEWDFGDGSATGSGEYVEHVYGTAGLYTVSLRTSDGLVEDTDTCMVDVGERDDPPHAVIAPDGPLVGDRLAPVTLSATGSSDDHGVVNLTWEMGDGTVLEGWSVSHQYDGVGIYPVTLTVVDTGGLFDINRTTVSIENLAPEIASVDARSKARVGERQTFSVSATDADGQVANVWWDFDAEDGINLDETGETVAHTFRSAGTFNVSCIVRDNEGGQAVYHMEVVVEEDGSSGMPASSVAVALLAMLLAAVLYLALDKKPYQSK